MIELLGKHITGDDHAPAVSVIIPAYQAAYIGAALDSVRAQTFKDLEVIVVNDGSPDTDELERELEPWRERLIYIKQENRGPSAARNRAIRAARGRFLAFLDADDYWDVNYLAEQMAYIENNPTADLVYADALLVGDSPLAGRTFMQTTPSVGEVTFESILAEHCTVILSGVVARKQPIVDVGLFDETFRYGEDFDLWLRLAKYGRVLTYQRKVLLCKRMVSGGLSGDIPTLFENALLVFDKMGLRNDLTKGERAALTWRANKLKAFIKLERGKRSLARGDFRAAAEAFKDANEFYRSRKLLGVLFCLRFSPNLLLRVYSFRRRIAV